jgi:drug/metabolite transporter (DMT)-like permease
LNNSENIYTFEKRKPAGLLPTAFQIFLSLLWGGNNVSIKTSLEYASPLQVGWMRFVAGGFVTFIYILIRKESLYVVRSEIRPLLIIGVLFTVQIVFMNVGQYLTTAGHATALNATYPVWASVIAHFLVVTDTLTRWKVLAIVMSYIGILIIVFGDTGIVASGVSVQGDFMSLLSAILLGLRLVLMSNFAQNMSEIKIMFGQSVMGISFFLIGSFIFESPQYSLELRFWLALAYQGFVIAGFGFLANAWLVKKYLPSTVTFYSFIQPPAGVLLAWLVLSEAPGRGLLVGLVFVVAGAITFGSESFIKARRKEILV